MSSSNNSTIPPLSEIEDNFGQIWTLSGNNVLLNGVSAASGQGSKILWVNSHIYVFGIDNNWWLWENSNWTNVGPQQPISNSPNMRVFWSSLEDLQTYYDNYGNKVKSIIPIYRNNKILVVVDMS